MAKLRHAVAHVNYKIGKDDLLTLWNKYKGKTDWKVNIKKTDMIAFLAEMADKYFMLYNQINNGQRKKNGQKIKK